MSRDDSVLFTGVNSASYQARAAERKDKVQKRVEERRQLAPAEERILSLIDKEQQETESIKSLLLNVPEEDVKAQLLAKKLHTEFLVSFKTSVSNILREPKGDK